MGPFHWTGISFQRRNGIQIFDQKGMHICVRRNLDSSLHHLKIAHKHSILDFSKKSPIYSLSKLFFNSTSLDGGQLLLKSF